MKKLKTQVDFVEALFVNFMLSTKQYMKNAEEKVAFNRNWMNKNCGKYALKRKITMIRQELLNLEKMIDEGGIF